MHHQQQPPSYSAATMHNQFASSSNAYNAQQIHVQPGNNYNNSSNNGNRRPIDPLIIATLALGPLDTVAQVTAALRRLRDSNEAILKSNNTDGVRLQLAGNPMPSGDVMQMQALQAPQWQLQMEVVRSKVLQLAQSHPEVAEAWNDATNRITAEIGRPLHAQTRAYQADLFDCLEDPAFCALATVLPCVAAGINRYDVTDGNHSGCAICCCLAFPLQTMLSMPADRYQDRRAMDIVLANDTTPTDNFMGDDLWGVGCVPCLWPCTLTQTRREIKIHRQQGYRYVDSLTIHDNATVSACKCERCQGRYVSLPTRQLMEVSKQLEQRFPQVAG